MTNTFPRESTKFRISSAPIEVPGKCASCGASDPDSRDYIDFGLFVEFVGTIYFCTFCFTECANALGWTNPQQTRDFEEKLDKTTELMLNYRTRLHSFDKFVDALRDTGILSTVEPIPSTVDAVAMETGKSVINTDSSSAESDDWLLDKQTAKQGRNDVPATGSDELTIDSFKL